jgi:putative flavoprotein involved in K+ transport
MNRLLARVDAAADLLLAPPAGASPLAPVPVGHAPRRLDLRAAGFGTIVAATGYRRSLHWLRLPVRRADGDIVHQGGITPVPGLFVIGLRFMRRRNSNFIDGVGGDARAILPLVAARLAADWRLSA